MSDYLNKTLIDLIPKCIDPETVGNFIPISLCNTIYKVVIKIIVNRLFLVILFPPTKLFCP